MEGNSSELSIETIRRNCNTDWRDEKPVFLDRMEFYCMKDVMADIYFAFKRPGDEQTVCCYFSKIKNNLFLEDSRAQICAVSCFRSVS